MRPIFLSLILVSGIALVSVGLPKVFATHDPTDYSIVASYLGWNDTQPIGGFPCSPNGAANCNPTVTEFRGTAFTVTVKWKDDTHNFAVYEKGTVDAQVQFPTAPCSSPCVAKSADVYSFNPTELLTFTAPIPPDDFNGPGEYEYYCEYHPGSMHGKIRVFKSPDVNGDGAVTIVDIATMAAAFGSTPASANWNIAADIDNEGDVDIVDIATAAAYFGKTLVD